MEVIEYKSNGHPDTLTDLCVENCANFLDNYYKDRYGEILHYNVDKALFLAGDAEIYFGGGRIVQKPKFILGGQVTNRNEELDEVLIEAIGRTVVTYLPNLKEFDIDIQCRNTAEGLRDIAGNTLANDTSFGVGHYPFSLDELMVKHVKNVIDEELELHDIPIGELYKIMLINSGVDISIYISAPLYADKVFSEGEYNEHKRRIEEIIVEQTLGVNVIFNPDVNRGNYYLTLCGSSVECGDDGQVGRGNRYNGLITPMQWMTIEAHSGKNNKNHTGKLYQKLAFEKAEEIYKKTGKPTRVCLISKIGYPITDYDIIVEHYGN